MSAYHGHGMMPILLSSDEGGDDDDDDDTVYTCCISLCLHMPMPSHKYDASLALYEAPLVASLPKPQW